MRYGILSDIHSNLEALSRVIDAYQDESIDKYLCVGDVVGYAINPNECIEQVKALAMVTVAGNHDWGSVDLFPDDYFNPEARQALFWTRQNLDNNSRCFLESLKLLYKNEDLTLVHATLDNPQEFNYMTDGYAALKTFALLETNICFIGHTHIAGVFIRDRDGRLEYRQDNHFAIEKDNQYIVNAGSVGQPRDRDPRAAYCIYDTNKKEIWIKRVNYDIQAARKKIIDAGLPRFLGNRLLLGR